MLQKQMLDMLVTFNKVHKFNYQVMSFNYLRPALVFVEGEYVLHPVLISSVSQFTIQKWLLNKRRNF